MLRFEPHQRSRVEIVRQGNIEKIFVASTAFGVVSVPVKEDRTQQVTVSSNGGYGIRAYYSKTGQSGQWYTVKSHWQEYDATASASYGAPIFRVHAVMCNGSTYNSLIILYPQDGQWLPDTLQTNSNLNCGSVVETQTSRVWEGKELTRDGSFVNLGEFASGFYNSTNFPIEIAKFQFVSYPIRYCPPKHGICWKDPVTKNPDLGWCCLDCAEVVGKSRAILHNVKIPKRI